LLSFLSPSRFIYAIPVPVEDTVSSIDSEGLMWDCAALSNAKSYNFVGVFGGPYRVVLSRENDRRRLRISSLCN
jgi:hypothetical protein